MATLTFQNLDFKEEQDHIKVIFYRNFSFAVPKSDLNNIADFKIKQNQIEFDCPEKRALRKFNQLISLNIKNLKNNITKNPAVYIHKNSGIPLIGSGYFGIIYRNNSTIEIKTQSSCNLNCIYCSISEGLQSKQTDFIVEKDYLVEEFKKLLDFIKEPVEVHIGVQGEPLLYSDLLPLIKELHQIKQVHTISMDTNATLLTKSIVDQLSQYKKFRINISLNAMDQKIAERLAGTNYNLKHVLDIIKYAASKIKILIAPLLVPGYNDHELIKIIEFAKKNNIKTIGIQNFLNYKTGRNPVKALDWEKFTDILKKLEKQTKTKLIFDLKKDFDIKDTKKLAKPFKKDQVIKATVVSKGRFPNSRLAVAENRNITVFNCTEKTGRTIKIKILRDKHNIFLARKI